LFLKEENTIFRGYEDRPEFVFYERGIRNLYHIKLKKGDPRLSIEPTIIEMPQEGIAGVFSREGTGLWVPSR
jgi:hypothetical protein